MKKNEMEFCKYLADNDYVVCSNRNNTYSVERVIAYSDNDYIGTLEEIYDEWKLEQLK